MHALSPSQAMSLGDDELESSTGTGEGDDITVVARSSDTETRPVDWPTDGARGIRLSAARDSDLHGIIRVALYARFSDGDLQNPLSVVDQLDMCRDFAARHPNWKIVAVYHDEGIPGQTIYRRPGMQQLLQAAERREFDVLLCESMSRISRSYQMGEIYAQFQFAGIRIITLIEGEISEVHIGMKGTMNALYSKDLAAAVRRGQSGMTRHGRSMGCAYGYDIVKQVDADGEPIRGLRRINEAEAEIVRRIFREYTAGISPTMIARRLNDEGIPGPSGKKWRAEAIRGNPALQGGILNNVIYIGKLVYNRTTCPRHPITGRPVIRVNPPEQWITTECPDLRILDQELWDAAKRQRQEVAQTYSTMLSRLAATRAAALNSTHRPRKLLSRLLVCGHCGGSYVGRGQGLYVCLDHLRLNNCPNWRSIPQTELEERVFAALRGPLLEPDVLVEAMRGYAEEIQRLNRERTTSYSTAGKRLSQVERAIGELVVAFENGNFSRALRARLDDLERERDGLERTLASAPPADIPIPSIDTFRERITRLSDALGQPERDGEAVAVIRSLIDHITITPDLDYAGPRTGPKSKSAPVDVTLHGDLSKIFAHIVGPSAGVLLTSVEGCTPLHRDHQLIAIKI